MDAEVEVLAEGSYPESVNADAGEDEEWEEDTALVVVVEVARQRIQDKIDSCELTVRLSAITVFLLCAYIDFSSGPQDG